MNRKETTTQVLKELGISPDLSGFHYMRYAIELICENRHIRVGMTGRIYPSAADRFGVKPSMVERSIRHAIECGWMRGNIELQDKLFGYTVDQEKGNPTNKQFVATVADHVLMLEEEK